MKVVSWIGFSMVHGEGPVWSGLTRTSQDTAQDRRQAHLSEVVACPWQTDVCKIPPQINERLFSQLEIQKILVQFCKNTCSLFS